MSTPRIDANPAAAAGQPDAATAGPDKTAGKFQGSSAAVVSSRSGDVRPDPGTAPRIAAWKLGEKSNETNQVLKYMDNLIPITRSNALARQKASNASEQKGDSQARSAKKTLMRIFKKGSRTSADSKEKLPAAQRPYEKKNSHTPADSKQTRLTALSNNPAVVLKDTHAAILIEQATTCLESSDFIPRAREILKRSDNRQELVDFCDQSLQGKDAGRATTRHFRNLSTSFLSSQAISDTKNAGQRIMQAAHPGMNQQKQEMFAERIDLGATIISRMHDLQYVPERQELQHLVESRNFKDFGSPDEKNPYLALVKDQNFTNADDKHIRGALLDALQLMEDSAQLLSASVLGEESSVEPQQLIDQAERLGIAVSVKRETTFAEEVNTETSFQVAESNPPPPAGEKLETTV